MKMARMRNTATGEELILPESEARELDVRLWEYNPRRDIREVGKFKPYCGGIMRVGEEVTQ